MLEDHESPDARSPYCFESIEVCSSGHDDNEWAKRALVLLDGDGRRSADTHLLRLDAPGFTGVDIYLKDESTHPTGSLKHRLARSLFLFGICNGQIRQGTPLVEASSGSTAVSEAYFACLLGLPFHAIMPRRTSPEKIAAIEFHGGRCHFVDDASAMYSVAENLAESLGGHYLDQFTNAERVTDWRGNNNIAESIFEQMRSEPHPTPEWIVMSAGTGGTSATIGRYIRYSRRATKLCVVDVEGSVFFDSFQTGDASLCRKSSSRIEGIGRPRVEPSFIPKVIDRMIRVPDAASIGAMRVLSRKLRRRVGASTGTNFFGLCMIAAAMRQKNEHGSLLTLICDDGQRYQNTYYNDDWLASECLDIRPWEAMIEAAIDGGRSSQV